MFLLLQDYIRQECVALLGQHQVGPSGGYPVLYAIISRPFQFKFFAGIGSFDFYSWNDLTCASNAAFLMQGTVCFFVFSKYITQTYPYCQ